MESIRNDIGNGGGEVGEEHFQRGLHSAPQKDEEQ